MKLYELMDNMEIQGNIRLAVYDDCGKEIDYRDIDFCDGLDSYELRKLSDIDLGSGEVLECDDLQWCEVMYMFCEKDCYLRIELEYKEDD